MDRYPSALGMDPSPDGQPPTAWALRPATAPLPVVIGANGHVRKELIGGLARSFERHAGFQISDGVLKKLEQRFAPLTDAEMERTVMQMKGLPFHHPAWQSLLDLLTVHETYFFRDAPQLEQVKGTLIPRIIDHAVKRLDFRLRLWSAGCSSGEEVYMLAFLVLEELIQRGQAQRLPNGDFLVNPAWNIEVMGSDISAKVLDQARGGRYRANLQMSSFRELPPGYRVFFSFHLPGGGDPRVSSTLEYAEIKPSVRRLTRFVQQNLAEGNPPSGGEFDLVFCRNVLIYFQDEVKLKVQEMLHRSLRRNGYLVLGPPDALLLPKAFRRMSGNLSVCYEKC